jgi:hypothetical protein
MSYDGRVEAIRREDDQRRESDRVQRELAQQQWVTNFHAQNTYYDQARQRQLEQQLLDRKMDELRIEQVRELQLRTEREAMTLERINSEVDRMRAVNAISPVAPVYDAGATQREYEFQQQQRRAWEDGDAYQRQRDADERNRREYIEATERSAAAHRELLDRWERDRFLGVDPSAQASRAWEDSRLRDDAQLRVQQEAEDERRRMFEANERARREADDVWIRSLNERTQRISDEDRDLAERQLSIDREERERVRSVEGQARLYDQLRNQAFDVQRQEVDRGEAERIRSLEDQKRLYDEQLRRAEESTREGSIRAIREVEIRSETDRERRRVEDLQREGAERVRALEDQRRAYDDELRRAEGIRRDDDARILRAEEVRRQDLERERLEQLRRAEDVRREEGDRLRAVEEQRRLYDEQLRRIEDVRRQDEERSRREDEIRRQDAERERIERLRREEDLTREDRERVRAVEEQRRLYDDELRRADDIRRQNDERLFREQEIRRQEREREDKDQLRRAEEVRRQDEERRVREEAHQRQDAERRRIEENDRAERLNREREERLRASEEQQRFYDEQLRRGEVVQWQDNERWRLEQVRRAEEVQRHEADRVRALQDQRRAYDEQLRLLRGARPPEEAPLPTLDGHLGKGADPLPVSTQPVWPLDLQELEIERRKYAQELRTVLEREAVQAHSPAKPPAGGPPPPVGPPDGGNGSDDDSDPRLPALAREVAGLPENGTEVRAIIERHAEHRARAFVDGLSEDKRRKFSARSAEVLTSALTRTLNLNLRRSSRQANLQLTRGAVAELREAKRLADDPDVVSIDVIEAGKRKDDRRTDFVVLRAAGDGTFFLERIEVTSATEAHGGAGAVRTVGLDEDGPNRQGEGPGLSRSDLVTKLVAGIARKLSGPVTQFDVGFGHDVAIPTGQEVTERGVLVVYGTFADLDPQDAKSVFDEAMRRTRAKFDNAGARTVGRVEFAFKHEGRSRRLLYAIERDRDGMLTDAYLQTLRKG